MQNRACAQGDPLWQEHRGGQSRSWGCGCSAVCWGHQGRAGVTEASMDSGSGTREWGEASRVDREGAAGLLLVTAVC